MTAKLVYKTENQRFYELSEYINTGINITGKVSISKIFHDNIKLIRHEYKDELLPFLTDKRGTRWICVSDATTHIERLVFPAIPIQNEYDFLGDYIDGKSTMMIYGGDINSVYNDEVYLRHLSILNGLKWEGINN